jgi:hypothetical protein
MEPPERLTVPACIGCWSMRLLVDCEPDCAEQKLELVHAEEYDELARQAAGAQAALAALADVAQRLATAAAEQSEPAYRAAQAIALGVLLAHPSSSANAHDSEPAQVRTAWWSPECGSVEASEECLGICVWRPLEWVALSRHRELEQQLTGQRERAARVRALLGTLAHTTPRPGHWERSLALIQAQARALLAGD